jgi:hypothetical protein
LELLDVVSVVDSMVGVGGSAFGHLMKTEQVEANTHLHTFEIYGALARFQSADGEIFSHGA